jgi:signal transduction histidine kinase
VFEKFRQGGDALNRPQGTGLGLPISRQIVEHFGGRMWLRDDRARRVLRLHATAGTTTPEDDKETPMTHKILIADDEPNILISLEYLMKREGYQVLVARDGRRRWT